MRIVFAMLCGIVVASCSQSPRSPLLPADVAGDAAVRKLSASVYDLVQYRAVYRFAGAPRDGSQPRSGLLPLHGALYGTTVNGGSDGVGSVYSIGASGKERVIYRFPVISGNGRHPQSPLIALRNTLYGTTLGGGGTDCDGGCGTVFAVNKDGSERPVYAFTGGSDGQAPIGGLVALNGKLYGTTSQGGCVGSDCAPGCNCGSVFAISLSGVETFLHGFSGPGFDGAYPRAGLTYAHGTFYGVTYYSVFSISPQGTFHVLHRFSGTSDGMDAEGVLLSRGGALYGTTALGGGTGCGGEGCGTVFEITRSGKERVIYRFKGGDDGSHPIAGVLAINGDLYGTTSMGGGACKATQGCGAIFSVNPATGEERVRYRFKGGPDGKAPGHGTLVEFGGALYGTTENGGSGGSGTVFKFVP